MSRKYVNEKWQDYEHKVLSPSAPSKIQRIETRRAFYAGAIAMFDILLDNLPDDESDMSLANDVRAELQDWIKQLSLKRV